MPNRPREVVLDSRRRTSFAKVGRRQDTRYLVEELEDGTLILTPAVTIPATELAALQDPRLRETLTVRTGPDELRRRAKDPPPA
jgi:hypothetical protein